MSKGSHRLHDRVQASHEQMTDNWDAIEWDLKWGCYTLDGELIGKGKTFDDAKAIGDRLDDGLSYQVRKV